MQSATSIVSEGVPDDDICFDEAAPVDAVACVAEVGVAPDVELLGLPVSGIDESSDCDHDDRSSPSPNPRPNPKPPKLSSWILRRGGAAENRFDRRLADRVDVTESVLGGLSSNGGRSSLAAGLPVGVRDSSPSEGLGRVVVEEDASSDGPFSSEGKCSADGV